MNWNSLTKLFARIDPSPRRPPMLTEEVAPSPSTPAAGDVSLRPYRLHMHHIGGRDGHFPFPAPPMFHGDIEAYLYDADPDCLDYMKRTNSPMVHHILAETIGAHDGATTFNLNYDPYTSSLRSAGEPEWFCEYEQGDYPLGEVLQPLQRRTVQAKTLTTIRRERGLIIDYLSLDVQGAEDELLAGLDDDGWQDVLAVSTEVSTREFYAGQALFHQVCARLHARGFGLVRFPAGREYSNLRTGLGWRGTGFPAHGDALFFRDDQHLARHATQPGLSLYKLAFIAICFGNVSYALKCATEAERLGGLLLQCGRAALRPDVEGNDEVACRRRGTGASGLRAHLNAGTISRPFRTRSCRHAAGSRDPCALLCRCRRSGAIGA